MSELTDTIKRHLSMLPDHVRKRKTVKLLEYAQRDLVDLEEALHDAIRRPLGVVPQSADPWYSQEQNDLAEERRKEVYESP